METLSDWLNLWHVPGIGPANFNLLIHHFGSPRKVFLASHAELRTVGISKRSVESILKRNQHAIDPDLQWAQHPEHHILTLNDSRYPPRLREIANPPPLLYVHGDPSHLSSPQLAMVGSRHPTPGGRENAKAFAAYLAAIGLTITSGLALGIDAASHEGALDNEGISIAVAATGLDKIYPATHRNLVHRIAKQGAIVSEFPIGTLAKAVHFPRRNRIISGLSLGILVVEATRRSGSLITARCAIEQGREVFAVPGSIHNPMARGCHQLIKQGAKLVESAGDILEELNSLLDPNAISCLDNPSKDPHFVPRLDPQYVNLLDCLGYDPVSIDVIIDRSGLTAEEVSSMLLILELEGYVACASGGVYTRLATEGLNERISD
jgi:DNA processing protein